MRDFRPSNRSGGYRDTRRYDATCDNCGQSCQVPFRPSGDKPVYCDKCFAEKSGRPAHGPDNRRFSRPDSGVRHFNQSDPQISELKTSLNDLHVKLDKILTLLGNS